MILFWCFLFGFNSQAQVSRNFLDKAPPQYEVGIGSVVLNTPDYPGSKNSRFRALALPYVIYRGNYMRADDEGTRARLFYSDYHEIGLSFGFNFPVKSSDNNSRQGLPDLDSLLEIGPRLMFRLIRPTSTDRLNFNLPVRAVYSSNFKSRFRAEGVSIEPSLNYWHKWQKSETTFLANVSFEFGSVALNRFFYEVQGTQATTLRPQYSARSGLVETSVGIGLGQNLSDRVLLFTGTSWRNLDWAANRESPIVETNNNFAAIVGFIWTFYESESQVIQTF